MKDLAKLALLVAMAVAFLVLPITCSVYKFKECRRAGFSLIYCTSR